MSLKKYVNRVIIFKTYVIVIILKGTNFTAYRLLYNR